MRLQTLLVVGFFCAASALAGAAQELKLEKPVDCELGTSCYIQNFVDADPSENAKDFACNALSYNGHKGTDFGLPYRADIDQAISVFAAADGVVRGLRDGEEDGLFLSNPQAIANKECGNGVVLDHGDGWETQYCHLKKGSVAVVSGQRVQAGEKLGEVGISGKAAFAHLHLSVRHHGMVIDPFNADGKVTCGFDPNDTLWSAPLAYQPGGIIGAGFSDHLPEFDQIKSGKTRALSLNSDADALVVWVYFFGGRKGDVVEIDITGPAGFTFNHRTLIKKTQALAYRAAGKRRRANAWEKGQYQATLLMIRKGETISRHETRIFISD